MRRGEPPIARVQLVLALGNLRTEFENGSLQAVLGPAEAFVGLVQVRSLPFEATFSLLQFQLAPVEFRAAAADIGIRFRHVLERHGSASERGPFSGLQ